MHANRFTRATAAALALVFVVTASGGIGAAAGGAGSDDCDDVCQADLARARAATERYRDWTAAAQEGFVQTGDCISSPEGSLAIGWTHLPRVADGRLSVDEPEALLYVRRGNTGTGYRLVGLEYSAPVDAVVDRPSLFGRGLSGPEPARLAGLPDRYVLRVWLYSDNPSGIFADANPAEACARDDLVDWHGKADGCLEVAGQIAVPEERVRPLVPEGFVFQPAGPGTVQINVGTHHCERGTLADGTVVEPLMFGYYTALLQPIDYTGLDYADSRYVLRFHWNDEGGATWMRDGMQIGEDVIGASTAVRRDYDPLGGVVDPSYRFTTPDFILDALVLDTPVEPWLEATVRFVHESLLGTAGFWIWARVAAASDARAVGVTPLPGSLLAELVGCEAPTCDRILAHDVLVTRLDTAVRLTAS